MKVTKNNYTNNAVFQTPGMEQSSGRKIGKSLYSVIIIMIIDNCFKIVLNDFHNKNMYKTSNIHR